MTAAVTPFECFLKSLDIGYQEWRNATGYDLLALKACNEDERNRIERLLLKRGVNDWRDIEALAELGTPEARDAIRAALKSKRAELRLHAAQVFKGEADYETELEEAIVYALGKGNLFDGLILGLDAAAKQPTPKVQDALFRLAKHGEGLPAGRAAAMLFFLHGLSEAHFDMRYGDFFLRFGSTRKQDRRAVFEELCARLGANPARYP